MELKYLSENCLGCKCRTCKSTYKSDDNSSCYTWCEEECKGEEPLDFRPDKECYELMDNYCEYIHVECEYIVVCKNYDGVCAKDMLGNYFRTEGYLPEDILARIKQYEEKEKKNKELESI